MTKLEMVREALSHLGDATAEDVAGYIERRHRVRIPPPMIPVVRASLRELEMLERFRAESRRLAEQVAKAPSADEVQAA
jgi:hypothetical protein